MFKPPLNVKRAEVTHRTHDSEILTVTLSEAANFQPRQMTEGRLLVQSGELVFKRTVKTQEVTAHTLQVVRGRNASEVFAQEYQSPETIAALDENKRKAVLRRGLRLVPLMVIPGHPDAEEVVQAARLMLLSEPLDELSHYEGPALNGAAEELSAAAPDPTPKKRKARSEQTAPIQAEASQAEHSQPEPGPAITNQPQTEPQSPEETPAVTPGGETEHPDDKDLPF